jgi:pyrrolidone-carboxylate peptidase
MNKILIYTFYPFKHYKRNSAQDLVTKLSIFNNNKLFLKTDYNPQKLFAKIDELKPDIVLGIGQSSKRFVKVETIFSNRKKPWGQKEEEEVKFANKPFYQANIDTKKVAKILDCPESKNAGRQNCNFTSYKVLEKIEQESLNIKTTFIHVPNVKYFVWTKYLSRFEKLITCLQN